MSRLCWYCDEPIDEGYGLTMEVQPTKGAAPRMAPFHDNCADRILDECPGPSPSDLVELFGDTE